MNFQTLKEKLQNTTPKDIVTTYMKYFEKATFYPLAIVEKTREKYLYNGLEIAIDNVKDLNGYFIEIEIKTGLRDKNRIYDFLEKELNWDAITECEDDYLAMILAPEKNKGRMIYFLDFNTKK